MRAISRVFLAAIIITIAVVPPAFSQKVIDEIVARVGNDIILKSEYEAERQAVRADLAQQGFVNQVAQQGLLDIVEPLFEIGSLQALTTGRGLGKIVADLGLSRFVLGLQNDVAVDPGNNLINGFDLCQSAGSN